MRSGETGAVIGDNIITLYFVDGKRGDSDLNGTNGIIVDPGGPSNLEESTETPAAADSDDDSSGCFIGNLIQ